MTERPRDRITPPAAPPAGDVGATVSPKRPGRRPYVVVGLMLVTFVAVLAAVVFVLPDVVEQRRDGGSGTQALSRVGNAPSTATEPESAPSTPPERQQSQAQRDAEGALGQLLRRQTTLSAAKADVWGGSEYRHLLELTAQGDSQYAAGGFAAALDTYQRALSLGEALESSKAERLAQALAAGDAALSSGAAGEAARQFAIAQAIDAGNAAAQRGAARAATLDQVLALMDRAISHEGRGELEQARALFEQALALDEHADPARQALQRVDAALSARAFRQALSEALAAIDDGRWPAAHRALARALDIDPTAPAVRDAALRLQQAEERAKIAAHRQRAETYVAQERWHEAAREYAAILAIDANAGFASDARQRSMERARVHDAIDRYLNDPSRLQSAAPRADARALIDRVVAMQWEGALLRSKLERLRPLLREAELPRKVMLISDNTTSVVLHRVGHLGAFDKREVMLLPGEYTAVGTRRGYRDVRRRFSVDTERPTPAVEIRCEEPI